VILAIETSGVIGGIALVDHGLVLGESVLCERDQMARDLLPRLDALLGDVGRKLDSVRAIALSIGPGSFTGLRIGLATALGLCFYTERRIVPVPTLGALALNAATVRGPIAPLLDARRGQIYAGLYTPDGMALVDDRATDPEPFLRSLEGCERVVVLGSGAQRYLREIEAVLGSRAEVLAAEVGVPRAASVGLLGERMERDHGLPPERVELRYLRESYALAPAGLDTPGGNA